MRQLLTEMRKILPKPKVAGSSPVCRSIIRENVLSKQAKNNYVGMHLCEKVHAFFVV